MLNQIQQRLQVAAERQLFLRFWRELALGWGLAALLGLVISEVEGTRGSWLPFCLVAVAGLAGTVWVNLRQQVAVDQWGLARQVEAHFPELDGRLITALEQKKKEGEWSYLQSRLNEEVAEHAARNAWGAAVSRGQLVLGQSMHWLALGVFLAVLWQLRTTGSANLLTGFKSGGNMTVSPGDITLERGNSLVVLARFNARRLPSMVELVSADAISGKTNRVPLVKTLGDPTFGVSMPQVQNDFTYHVEYGAEQTKEFRVTVFEHPRLEKSDADLVFPAYTGQAPKRIENTRRLTAVEGTRASLKLTFNKSVVTARLVPKDKQTTGLILAVATNEPTAELNDLKLQTNSAYTLELVDAEGRTNKSPEQFVFEVTQNRSPEIRLTSPHGDTRPSALEEITFKGTVWDDFGVLRYGLGYFLAGQDPVFIELGGPAKEKAKVSFEHLLRLESLGVKPDDFITWFAWADDLGPDGEERRSTSSLFFAEVRPFDEVFREGQDGGGAGPGEGQQGGGGNGREPELTEIQKDILNATWNLRRSQPKTGTQKPAAKDKAAPATSPGHESRFHSEKENSLSLETALRHLRWSAAGQRFLAQAAPSQEARSSRRTTRAAIITSPGNYQTDLQTVREAQQEALAMAEDQLEQQQDPRTATLLRGVVDAMKKSLSSLESAERSPERLPEALAAQQTAYQALLKLQEHEYQVQRSRRNQGQGGNSRQQKMQQQLDEMELTQSENRYETQRQAQAPKSAQQQETQKAFNRLQELARRQQDLNEQFKEMQTALQEAASEEQRNELRRRLKKLQEEEQELLSDLDEMRQRMNRPENQSRMAEQQRRLEQTREQVQRAAEAAEQGSASQALAAGTRAQRDLQDLRDELRKESSNQFSDEMRQARNQARELVKEQEELLQKLSNEEAKADRSLSGSSERKELLERLARQRQRMTNLVDHAMEVSQQAETAEPLLSRHLDDSLRKFSQDSAKNVQEAQSQLLNRGMMTRSLLDQLNTPGTPDGAKLVDITTEMLRQDFLPQARDAGQRSRSTLEDLKRGIEQAAESVLGDEAEALRMAEQELKRLSDQLGQEMSLAQQPTGQTNGAAQSSSSTNGVGSGQANQAEQGVQGEAPGMGNREEANAQETAGQGQGGQNQGTQRPGENRGTGERLASGGGARRSGSPTGGGGEGGDVRGGVANVLDRLFDQDTVIQPNPLTGEDYARWADQLRDVEQMIESPDLRNDVAAARERARRIRQDFRKDRKKPDWAVVQLQVMQPLAEVRKKLLEELARLENQEPMAPIDRDPVPTQYSDLVRRYYESLGKGK